MEDKPKFFDRMRSMAKSAGSRSGEMVEAARISGEINRIEADIEDIQFELGKAYYEAHKEDMNCEFAPFIQRILSCEAEIRERDEKLLARKGLMHCPDCDTVIGMEDEYCSKCGKRLPGPPPVGNTVACRNCGGEVDRALTFCPQCGFRQ